MIRLLVDALGDPQIANDSAGWPPALLGLSVITLVVGNVAALVQKDVKRMLAYSSISHAGFLLLGMVAAWKLGGGLGVRSVLFYLAGYAVSNLLAFGSLIAAGSYGKEATSYEDLAGLGRRHPWLAIPFSLGILSLMGFPPTAGFFAKYYVILAAVQGGGLQDRRCLRAAAQKRKPGPRHPGFPQALILLQLLPAVPGAAPDMTRRE